jgi:hypothetical protein
MGGGFLAAYLDQQNDTRTTTLGRGARAGLQAGVFGAVVWLIVSLVLDPLLAPIQERVIAGLIRAARDMRPDARGALESIGASSPLGYAFDFLALLFAGAIFSTLGGVIGAAFFRNDVPPALGGPIQPPPL